VDPFKDLEIQDPFAQMYRPEAGKIVLRQRTSAARKSGHLNISALDLKEIPTEVMTMYDFDPDASEDWYECVDLVKFIAADNQLESLPDVAFPDVDLAAVDVTEDVQGSQFGGLEVLDLHGNLLHDLPKGLRRLHRLQSLNLSNNTLTTDAFEIISEIEQLTELRLARNGLAGELPSELGRLRKLEVLDLHGNELTDLCDSLEGLTCLRIVNVSENQLTRLPFDILGNLPLTEINARKNNLRGALVPSSVSILPTLQILNVACNSLEQLSQGDTLELPSLQQLFADANRISSLPNISSWQSLCAITMEDNSLTQLPEGFSSLQSIKHADFTGNSLVVLDDNIGIMEDLTSFRVANNPLREKRLLTFDTEDLKRELRSRIGATDAEEEDGSEQTEFTIAPESPPSWNKWRLKPGGVLELSCAELSELDPAEMRALVSTNSECKCVYLRRNNFECVPVAALSHVTHSLTDLDLSRNPLSRGGLLTASIALSHLQSLTLSSCGLVSLEPLLEHLSAPALTFLDVSNNSLSGPLPCVRNTFPSLVTFLAADNGIESLSYEAVHGLQVLDVSNNNIDSLPPRIGLLGPEETAGGATALRRFDVAGNSFRVPRWQIVANGTEAILEWLKNRITDEELREWQCDWN
jgi:Leucine-rich repeat (LRR) protein